jgi:hypothetical protein
MQAKEQVRAMTKPRQPSLSGLIGRSVDLAQKVAVDELRLLRAESREYTKGILLRGAVAVVASVCFLFAWIALCATVVVVLEPQLVLSARLGLVAGAHVLIGVALLVWARRETSS